MVSIRPPLVDSIFDGANWFMDKALNEGEYLQPQKLHRLMFLAQAYYAAAFGGRRLLPGVFLADAMGPIEPNVYRVFQNDRPWLGQTEINDQVAQLLESIWRKFGSHSADYLTKMVRRHPPYAEAFAQAPRSVITEEAMAAFYGRKDKSDMGGVDGAPAGAPPSIENVIRPRIMRSHKGNPVSVMPWMPKVRDPAKDKDGQD